MVQTVPTGCRWQGRVGKRDGVYPQIHKGYFGKVLVQVIQLYHLTQLDHVLQLDYMDDVVTVHLKVPRGIWMALRADAMGRGRSAQEHVVGMFRVAYGVGSVVGELRAGGTDVDAQRVGSIPRAKTVKTTLDVVSESKPPAPSSSELKEGYGWCRVCGKNQVKLPHFLCSTCQKL